jgi:signal transduction histidine kinase/CheY-like chemotaxis protein
MEMFVQNTFVDQLEAQLSAQPGLALLVELAWHLRQRDTRRALNLVAQAYRMMRHSKPGQVDKLAWRARLSLARAETMWLLPKPRAAERLVNQALTRFTQLGDPAGLADGYWLKGRLADERGDNTTRVQLFEQALAAARQSGDPTRLTFIKAQYARLDAFLHYASALARWEAELRADLNLASPAAASAILNFLGITAALSGDVGGAATFFVQAHELALESGQIRIAIIAISNVADAFNKLNDYQTALNWGQRALDLARDRDWPGISAICLTQCANSLRHLGQVDAALLMLQQALYKLQSLPQSRNHSITLNFLGDIALDQHDYDAARSYFSQLQDNADVLNQPELQVTAMRGLAQTLSQLDQSEAALEMAQSALQLAQEQQLPEAQIEVLPVLAEIHAHHRLPPPPAMHAANAPLHYLLEARSIAVTIAGYTVPGKLLDALAFAYANAGQYQQAFQTSLEANAAREKTHGRAATSRAVTMQVRLQTERARTESEFHRQLAHSESERAASEAKRAELLQQHAATLHHLSSIGQNLTTQLELEGILKALDFYVHQLLPVNSFVICLVDEDGASLSSALFVENGHYYPTIHIPINDPHLNCARVVRERREILIHRKLMDVHTSFVAGTMPMLSYLFIPLMIGERVLGVMSVQSLEYNAYHEREQLIFRTLCAYGAIAFDNARAQHRLQENARQLELAKQKAERETHLKSEFLANMSHEIRTPMNAVIGLSHLALRTTLNRKQQDYIGKIHRASVGLLGILNDILDFSKIEAGKLDIESTEFNLDDVLQHVATMTHQKAVEKKLEYLFHVLPHIPRQLIGDPLRLGQVLINLLNNAIKFCEQGEVELSCANVSIDETEINLHFAVRDTGIGMTAEQSQRLFVAFNQADVSTSRKFGGSGLGLSISQHLVQLMKGRIQVDSKANQGTVFHFTLAFKAAAKPEVLPDLPTALQNAPILISEAHPLARQILIGHCLAISPNVSACADPEQAFLTLRAAQNTANPIEVVFLGNTGQSLELSQRIQQQINPAPRIILLTRSDQEGEHQGISLTLCYPVIFSTLRQALIDLYADPSLLPAPLPGFNAQAPKYRVLVAEDNDINQQIAVELLAEQGVQVDIAADGQHVLNKLRDAGPLLYQLIFMDLEMPEMDGHECTRIIRKDPQYAAIPIIAMSAHAYADIQEQCKAEGMQDSLPKPFDPEMIRKILLKWLPGVKLEAAGSVETALPPFKHLDSQLGIKRVGGKISLYHQLLERFYLSQKNLPEQFQQACQAGEQMAALRMIHSLRGVAGNLGALALEQAAQTLELEIAPCKEVNALLTIMESPSVRHMEQVLNDVLTELAHYLAQRDAAPSPAANIGNQELVNDNTSTESNLDKLIGLLQESDSDAAEFFTQIKASLCTIIPEPALQQLAAWLNDYEFDTALAWVLAWVNDYRNRQTN